MIHHNIIKFKISIQKFNIVLKTLVQNCGNSSAKALELPVLH